MRQTVAFTLLAAAVGCNALLDNPKRHMAEGASGMGNAATPSTMTGGDNGGSVGGASGNAAATGGTSTAGLGADGGTTSVGGTGTGGDNIGGAANPGTGGAAGETISDAGDGNGTGGTGNGGTGRGGTGNGGTGGDGTMGGTGGSSATGGMGGSSATGGMTVVHTKDPMGVDVAKKGDSKTNNGDFLVLGDMRLNNNASGSVTAMCPPGTNDTNLTQMSVFVNDDGSVGWNFYRHNCPGAWASPDFPGIEFGINPFDAASDLATTPPYSSTTLLPIQIKDLPVALVTIDNLNLTLTTPPTPDWTLALRFWLSEQKPSAAIDPGVYAQVDLHWGWGWEDRTVMCGQDTNNKVLSGGRNYLFCQQDDEYQNGQWRYWEFRVEDGPVTAFDGEVDLSSFFGWLVTTQGYSNELWVTSIEIGTYVDDTTQGSVTVDNVTFNVNDATTSVVLGN